MNKVIKPDRVLWRRGFTAIALLLAVLAAQLAVTGQAHAQYWYGYQLDRYGRSTDPNCYRGRDQVYVCGYSNRRRDYGYDRFGRSRDPNCYRGPNRVYVCGPVGGYRLDRFGRSTDPNCYRGPNRDYVC
jgi:hypothetical protein